MNPARAGTNQSPWIKQLVDSPSVSKHEWTISFSGLRVVHSEGDENMKTLMIAAAAFATLIVTSVTDADARVGDSLLHDPSPMHEARRRPSGATLEACIL